MRPGRTGTAWLGLRSGSVLPAAVAHGAVNGWMTLVPLLVAGGGPVPWLTASPMGLLGHVALGILAALLLVRGPWTPADPPAHPRHGG